MADESKPPQVPSDAKDATALFFDRLDAAFSRLNSSRRAAPPVPVPAPEPELMAQEPPAMAAGPTAAPESAHGGPRLVAEAFSALLALEDGEPGARPVRLTMASGEPPAPPKISDAVMDDIVQRVIVRMGPDAVRAVVTEVVSDIAERLVREEIDRIRKTHV